LPNNSQQGWEAKSQDLQLI